MVRQYKIHTDLDGLGNRVFDMNGGKIRFYQPSDLGVTTTTNIWKSDGIGIFGDSQVNHNNIEFKLETFGIDLKENYQIFNDFINAILAQKFVTLEYTSEIGTFYADVKLSNVTKTEGYGFNGTFSEKIVFDNITAWYTYQQLQFTKFENGVIGDSSKVYGKRPNTVYPNLNLLDGTKNFTGDWQNSWGSVTDGNYNGLTAKKRTGSWSGIFKVFTVPKDGAYTFSSYLKSSGNEGNATVYRFGGINSSGAQSELQKGFPISDDWIRDSITLPNLKANDTVWFKYERPDDSGSLWTAGHKWEQGSTATPWFPSAKEVTPSDYSYYDSYKYNYTYFGEDNIERFSKWNIEENVFSFVARLTPSQNIQNKKYGLRFLNADANEYSAIVFNLPEVADLIQINTDTNDEYYQAIFNGQVVNMFSALDFQRFRTRIFEKGSMELIGLDSVEMNIKRKVDFI